jgi:hypothetical protein
MTCSHSSCVPKARTPSTWVTVLASQPSVSMETDTTQRMESPSARLADGVHHLAQQVLVGELVGRGAVAGALDDLAAEALDLVGRPWMREVVVQRVAGFELLAVDQQRAGRASGLPCSS